MDHPAGPSWEASGLAATNPSGLTGSLTTSGIGPALTQLDKISFDHKGALGFAELLMSWCSLPRPGRNRFCRGRIRATSPFDATFYRAGANLGDDLDPELHYVLVGELIGRLPSKDFDPGYSPNGTRTCGRA